MPTPWCGGGASSSPGSRRATSLASIGLDATGAALAAVASDVFDAAWRLAGAGDVAVIGMGKLGGAELNYASDVDVVFVGGADDRMARAVTDIARRCFRVDLNLRPEGRDGALVRSVASFEAYWERWAQPWEFQALLKARTVAGDRDLGDAFERAAGERLWSRRFSADDLRTIRAMKVRAENEIARRGLTQREVKRGPRRHSRHRVRGPAPAARARTARPGPALAHDGHRPVGAGRRRLRRSGRRRPAGRRLPLPADGGAPPPTGRRATGPRRAGWGGGTRAAGSGPRLPELAAGHPSSTSSRPISAAIRRRSGPSTNGSGSVRCSRRSPRADRDC